VALVCFALAGAEATASQAALHWTINGGELSGSETVKITGGPWTLSWPTVGTTVEVKAEKVECGSTCNTVMVHDAAVTIDHFRVDPDRGGERRPVERPRAARHFDRFAAAQR
jgi:hypothetical protein